MSFVVIVEGLATVADVNKGQAQLFGSCSCCRCEELILLVRRVVRSVVTCCMGSAG